MDIHDLEPLLPYENSSSESSHHKIRRKNSVNTFSSLRRYRCFMLIIIGILILAGFGILYHCPDNYCFVQKPSYTIAPPPAPLQLDIDFVSYNTIEHDNFEFNINGSDVIVFLHIQKTGGTTFGKHLVNDIDLKSPCLCRRRPKKKKKHQNGNRNRNNSAASNLIRDKRKMKCDCFRPNATTNWLFSRYSTGTFCFFYAIQILREIIF